jgi:hypothetical protein
MKYVSEETGLPTVILCRWFDRPEMECGDDKTAVALRGQWQGGDVDVDPHWVPVCAAHDARWDIDPYTGKRHHPRHVRLPRFPLIEAPHACGLCDADALHPNPVQPGWWTCTACGWEHVSTNCCA